MSKKTASETQNIIFSNFDIVLCFLALFFYFYFFYKDWPIWNDQAIFHVSAFRFVEGQIPYKDFILFHWPGTIILHSIAYLISGIDPMGLRILDCTLLFILSVSTSSILKSWGLNWPYRFVCIAPYIALYFGQWYEQTAQREGLQLPLLVAGLAPLLAQNVVVRYRILFLSGVITASAILVKPTSSIFVLAAILASGLNGYKSARYFFSFAFGFFGCFILTFLILLMVDAWPGFSEYALRYVSEAYALSRDSFEGLFYKFGLFFLGRFAFASPVFFLTVFSILVCVCAVFCRKLPRSLSLIYTSLLLMSAGLLQYYWQGKGWCYQLFPFQWTLGLLTGYSLLYLTDFKIFRTLTFRTICVLAPTFALFFVGGWFDKHPQPRFLVGTQIGSFLGGTLLPHEFILAPHFETMGVLMGSQTVPNYKFIEPSVIYASSPVESKYRKIILKSFTEVLSDPHLRYIVTFRRAAEDPNNALEQWIEDNSTELSLNEDKKQIRESLRSSYSVVQEFLTPEYSHSSYVIYERKHSNP